MVKQRWGCLYRLTNTANGKKYIGKTVNFKKRMCGHKNDKKKTYISKAIRKYGWENFKREKIIDDVPEEDLSNLEISYIEVENTMKPAGYNLTTGGEGTSGYKHTEETIKKMHNGRYGTACFCKQNKKWMACGSNPEKKLIGLYFTKEKAEAALKLYNETGKRMESDRTMRKIGTGNICKRSQRYRAQIKIKGKIYTKTFDTVEECEEWFKKIKNTV
jgi:group I intron endonuclease